MTSLSHDAMRAGGVRRAKNNTGKLNYDYGDLPGTAI
jgi:hypothetical protein